MDLSSWDGHAKARPYIYSHLRWSKWLNLSTINLMFGFDAEAVGGNVDGHQAAVAAPG